MTRCFIVHGTEPDPPPVEDVPFTNYYLRADSVVACAHEVNVDGSDGGTDLADSEYDRLTAWLEGAAPGAVFWSFYRVHEVICIDRDRMVGFDDYFDDEEYPNAD